LENKFLTEREFVASNGHPTIADLQVYFDLTMLRDFGVLKLEEKYKRVGEWIKKLD